MAASSAPPPDDPATPDPDDVDRMARALGWRPNRFRAVALDRGPAGGRWVVAAEDGSGHRRSAFVKIGATPVTAEWTRAEARNYAGVDGWFLPEVLGFDDDGRRPALALEDLSGADWPPPWSADRVAAVREALAAIHATPAPATVRPEPFASWPGWPAVAADPAPLLGLGLCSASWLDAALPMLVAASAAALTAGGARPPDIRSDNLCFRSGRAVILDWNHASRGNPDLDLAFWLPSLAWEGGPQPEALLPDAPGSPRSSAASSALAPAPRSRTHRTSARSSAPNRRPRCRGARAPRPPAARADGGWIRLRAQPAPGDTRARRSFEAEYCRAATPTTAQREPGTTRRRVVDAVSVGGCGGGSAAAASTMSAAVHRAGMVRSGTRTSRRRCVEAQRRLRCRQRSVPVSNEPSSAVTVSSQTRIAVASTRRCRAT